MKFPDITLLISSPIQNPNSMSLLGDYIINSVSISLSMYLLIDLIDTNRSCDLLKKKNLEFKSTIFFINRLIKLEFDRNIYIYTHTLTHCVNYTLLYNPNTNDCF